MRIKLWIIYRGPYRIYTVCIWNICGYRYIIIMCWNVWYKCIKISVGCTEDLHRPIQRPIAKLQILLDWDQCAVFEKLDGVGSCSAIKIFSRPGVSQGLLYKHLCHSLPYWLSHPLVKISLRCRHAHTVINGASSQKTN